MSQLFASSGQSIGSSASAFPMNIQGWFLLGLTGLISLHFKGLSRVFSNTTVWRHQFFSILPSLQPSSHNHRWPLGRPQPWLIQTHVSREMSLLFKWLSRVLSNTTVQKCQFFGAQLSLWSNSHIHTWLLEKPWLWLDRALWAKSLLFNMLYSLVIAFPQGANVF